MATAATITQESMYGYAFSKANFETSGIGLTDSKYYTFKTYTADNGVYYEKVGTSSNTFWTNKVSSTTYTAVAAIRRISDDAMLFVRYMYRNNEDMFIPAPNTYEPLSNVDITLNSSYQSSYGQYEGEYFIECNKAADNPKISYAGWEPSTISVDYALPCFDSNGDLSSWYPLSEEALAEAELCLANQMNYTADEVQALLHPKTPQREHPTYTTPTNNWSWELQYPEVLEILSSCDSWKLNGEEQTQIDTSIITKDKRYWIGDDRDTITFGDNVISEMKKIVNVTILRGNKQAKVNIDNIRK